MTDTTPRTSRPLLAIVGRPNVGKSTLFNRLIGARKAVVSHLRGTTRDRLEGCVRWRGAELRLADTGGLELSKLQGLAGRVQQHLRKTLDAADGFLLVCDGQQGLLPADELILEGLRKTGKPVMLAVNKLDTHLALPPEYLRLGIADVFAVSALHGRGIGELLEHMVSRLSSPAAAAPFFPVCAITIVGRQNVGKSSLLNTLLREERALVSEVPGTTRDTVDTLVTLGGESVALSDTAGLRHRRKVSSPIDWFSMERTVEAIERADVALVVLDATQGVTRDDQRIITRVTEAGCGMVILVNKWDLAKGGSERQVTSTIHRLLPAARFAPVLAVSAKTGFQVTRALVTARRVVRTMRQGGLSDAACFALLQRSWAAHPPTRFRGRAIRLKAVRLRLGRPATLELDTAPVGWLAGPYQQYLLKPFHAHPALSGVPIRLVVKGPNPH